MKELLDFKRFKFYGWIGLACFGLGFLTDLPNHKLAAGLLVLDNLWFSLYIVTVNYIFFEYTVPRLRWRKLLRSFLLLCAHLLLYSAGLCLWRSLGIALSVYHPTETFATTGDRIGSMLGMSFASLVFFGLIRHVYGHVKLRQAAQQLRIEKQQAELNYLKSQTNPHFLFNTLNNIYSLARDKSDLAPETILRLSKILRYMLYETGGPYIAIEQELRIIGDYISLEKLRYDDSLRVNFNYDVEDMKQALPPLLLMPLVENAFKHGVSETRVRPFVDIHLSVARRRLAFLVRNSTEGVDPERQVKENIGLSNLRRQLELLYTDYQVTVEQRASEFAATLNINLASHV